MKIHLARWILSPGRPPLENGGIATFGGKIVAVDKASVLHRHYHGKVVDHGDAILSPPLVNAHCHLELSALAGRINPGRGSFTEWVNRLIAVRQDISDEECINSIEEAVYQLLENGVAVLADTGNMQVVPSFIRASGKMWPFEGFFLEEIIAPRNMPGFNLEERVAIPAGARLSSPSAPVFLNVPAPHAPYTVAPLILKAIARTCAANNLPFSIHVAESVDETEFLRSGSGAMKALMKSKGHWPPDWDIPGTTPVQYLDSLGCLTPNTVCVHCVQVDRDDIEIMADRRVNVCLCPGSNAFIGVGNAPAFEMHRAGINLCLGTDSLASNKGLSILDEMATLASITPGLPPDAIFHAATAGGAKALGLEKVTGTLEPGKKALMIEIRTDCATAHDALEFMINYSHERNSNINIIED